MEIKIALKKKQAADRRGHLPRRPGGLRKIANNNDNNDNDNNIQYS